MLRPGELARPAAARTFTTELAWAWSPLRPRRLLLDGLIVIYHRRTFTGRTGSLMGCKRIDTIGLSTWLLHHYMWAVSLLFADDSVIGHRPHLDRLFQEAEEEFPA